MSRANRICLAAVAMALGLLGRPQAALAWKPLTHVYLAEQALKDVVADGRVTLYEVDVAGKILGELGQFEADPGLVAALRVAPGQYRAGVVGPDAFPDMLTGQQIIHPDVSKALPGGVSGSDAWLTHIWDASAGKGPEVRAFAAGFLIHAAGDVFAHTFVNSYTGGAFTIDPPTNATKHITLESYIGERTPDEGKRLPLNIGGVEGFIRDEMTLAKPGSVLQTHLLIGEGLMSVPFLFSSLRQDLQPLAEGQAAQSGFDLLDAAAAAYAQAWIADIDAGLGALPGLSAQVARAVIYPSGGMDLAAARNAFAAYARNHLWSMSGAPDAAVGMAYAQSDLAKEIIPEEVMEYAKLLVTETFKLTVLQATGTSVEDWADKMTNPERGFDGRFGDGALAAFNRDQLHIAGIDRGERWKIEDFPPAFNTVQLSKMVLLSDAGWRELAAAMAAKGARMQIPPRGGNVMLGWVHSLDGSNAWRGAPVPVFAANGAVYSKLFMPQRGAEPFN